MNRYLLILFALFILLSLGFQMLTRFDPAYNFMALMGGNVLMLLLCIIAMLLVRKRIGQRAESFVRGVYSATFLKLMVCLAAILVYVMLNRETLHKPTLFVLFGVYAVYTGVETWMLSQLARKAK